MNSNLHDFTLLALETWLQSKQDLENDMKMLTARLEQCRIQILELDKLIEEAKNRLS